MTAWRKISIASAICIALSIFSPIQSAQAVSTYPTAPQALTVSAAPAGFTLSWTPPSDTATGITAYQAEYSTDGTTWVVASNSIPGNGSSYTMTSLNPNSPYYIRLAAKATNNLGPYAYPWTKIYGTANAKRDGTGHIQYQSGYGIAVGDTATTLANKNFSRVRYRMQSTILSVTEWADVDFTKWDTRTNVANSGSYSSFTVPAANISTIQVPTTNSSNTLGTDEQFTIKTNINDLTINSSKPSLIGFSKIGRLELWPWNYDVGNTETPTTAYATKYDWDDSPAMSAAYGSFQVHDLTPSSEQSIIAWNNHASNQNPDVGYGSSNLTYGGHYDWTFSATYQNGTAFLLEIFVNTPSMSGNMGIGSVTIDALTGAIKKRTAKTITARTVGPGFVTFFANGRKIAGCISVPTSANVATCSWRPLTQGQNTVTATFTSPSYTTANGSTSPSTVGKR